MLSAILRRSLRRKPVTKALRRLRVEPLELRVLLNSDGTLLSFQTIADGAGGGPSLADRDWFGGAVSTLGDLDGDGVTDLGVGAEQDQNTGTGTNRGALHVLFMNSDGTVKNAQKIAGGVGGGPGLRDNDWFGSSISPLAMRISWTPGRTTLSLPSSSISGYCSWST